MDRFDNMRVFAKIAGTGSFAGAAARLGISPSMASQHVKVLEESLGVRLLFPSRKRQRFQLWRCHGPLPSHP